MMHSMHAATVLLAGAALAGCGSASSALPRYIVSSAPLALFGAPHPGICVAIDPSDATGVWWWEPGRSGCSSRSTGPGVFPADRAAVTPPSSGVIVVTFQLQLKTGGPLPVTLTLRDGAMLEERTGLRVATERKGSRDVPEMAP
jgi:hypothetical protein